jgi:hypothetical protein
MATKNLARTLIEGGRASGNKYARRRSHRLERALTREHIARALATAEGFEALSIGKRPKVYKHFDDKLGPPRRWLRSQVGRPWGKVRSEMVARFNPRTLAGQHILYDHLLPEVRQFGDVRRRAAHALLYVDRHGLLRESRPARTTWRRRVPIVLSEAVRAWADGRLVRAEGDALYWMEQVRTCTGCGLLCGEPCCCPHLENEPQHGAHHHYRQGRRLDTSELARFRSLRECERAVLEGRLGAGQ